MPLMVILYPGSFDPLHIGHTALANYVVEYTSADEIWFLPTPQNPYKKYKSTLPYEVRCACIQKSIQGDPRFKLCTIEQHLPYPHYTVRTLQALKMMYPHHSFSLLMGADNWESIGEWHEGERIVQENRILVYPRLGSPLPPIPNESERLILLHQAPKIEISSTQIRSGFQEKKNMHFWMPSLDAYSEVEKYIQSTTPTI